MSNIPPEPGRRIRPVFMRRPDETAFTANERQILDLIRSEGPLSRADLARRTELALQSVVRLADGLIERGFLIAGERVARGGPGQPSAPLSLVADAACCFGVSILTDGVSLVLMDLAGVRRATRRIVMEVDDRTAVLRRVRRELEAMLRTSSLAHERVFGAGVAISGYFVGPAQVNAPMGMEAWSLLDLEEAFTTALGLPVWVENDGNAAAVGESLYGVGRRHSSFAYIYMGAGVGGGVISGGVLIRGARGNAGEFTGLLPPKARGERPTMTLLLEILHAHGVEVASLDDLQARFDPAWPGVDAWLERTRPACTAILSAIGAIVDPEVIVLGGRIPVALAEAMALRAEFYQGRLRDRERAFPRVVAAEAVGDAGALGAAALPFKDHIFR